MKRATFVVTMMLLLASACVVGAGWVLWVQKTHQDSSTWELEGASDSLGGCRKAKRDAWESMVKHYQDESIYPEVEYVDKNPYDRIAVRVEPKRASASGSKFIFDDVSGPEPTEDEKRIAQRKELARRTTTYRFLCIPDTIDPREKK